MKKLISFLLLVCMLAPLGGLAESESVLPEGYRLEDFGDFTLPIPPNGMVWHFDPETDDGWVAEILYLDVNDPAFQPYMVIWWFPNNMSAYHKRVHPLDYGKSLTKELVEGLEAEGCTVTGEKTVYGMRKGDAYFTLCSMHIDKGGWFAEEAHDLWVYQRYYGTYEMGTYYFEIYAPTRAHVDEIVKDVEQAAFR